MFRLWGWRIEGEFPKDIPKYLTLGGPHTSNWDFVLSLLARTIQGADIKFMAKDSIFKFPFGWFFRKLGGYPVDRSQRNNFVQFVIDQYNNHERFAMAITPEGTRSRVDRFKTGFFHIAVGADIPVVPVVFDGKNKIYRINPAIKLTGVMEDDIETILNYYRGVDGINPEQGVFF
jgi:1-acyl-sn-glycerol-3-phosphate acyltransferase